MSRTGRPVQFLTTAQAADGAAEGGVEGSEVGAVDGSDDLEVAAISTATRAEKE